MPYFSANRLQSISQWLVLAVVFLLPVTALPWTLDPFEINKQAVLVVGVSLATASFVLALLLKRGAIMRPSLFTAVPVVLLLLTLASTSSSLAPMTGWIGTEAQAYVSVLSLVSCLGLFFLVQEFARTPRLAHYLLLAMLSSAAVVSLAVWPVMFGANFGLFTNLIGAPHAYAVYLLIMSILACGLWLVRTKFTPQNSERLFQVSALIIWVTSLAVLLALDSLVLWALTLVGVAVLFGTAFFHADKFSSERRLFPSISLAILAAIFLFLPTNFPSPFLPEVSPNLASTWTVINGAWNEGSVAYGSGPGTFALMHAKYVTLDVNLTDFWELAFDRGNAYVTTQLAGLGLAGVLTWLFFLVLIGVLAVKKLVDGQHSWRLITPLLAAWSVLVVGAFVYASNMTLTSLFWLLSAMLLSYLLPKAEPITLHPARRHLMLVLTTVFVLACSATSIYVLSRHYLAELAFARAVEIHQTASTAGEIDEVIRLLDRAAVLSPWHDVYARNLAGALLRRIAVLTADEAADNEYVQSLIATAIRAANRSTQLAPANVLNWDVTGLVYRELLPVLPAAAEPVIEAYTRAIELSPVNPRYRVELARAYLGIAGAQLPLLGSDDQALADQAEVNQNEALAQAREHLITALALKPDYVIAHYYLALFLERQGELAEAVRELEVVIQAAPDDVGVGLQLGLLYLRQGKHELAQIELQRILTLAPAYANAHWYLSVVFEQTNDLVNAILEVEQVLQTNPDNANVLARLNRLKAGQISEIIPEPLASPKL